jgi:hypothetical protein
VEGEDGVRECMGREGVRHGHGHGHGDLVMRLCRTREMPLNLKKILSCWCLGFEALVDGEHFVLERENLVVLHVCEFYIHVIRVSIPLLYFCLESFEVNGLGRIGFFV